MTTVFNVLKEILDSSISERDKGAKYETLCVWFLQNDPYWRSYFERVGTLEQAVNWADCPIQNKTDTGIDLVAQERESKKWWAIQCKFVADGALRKEVCDSFFARALGDSAVDRYMIMTSAASLSKHLEQQVQNTETMVIDTAKMAMSQLDWSAFIEGRKTERKTYDTRPHQRHAIDNIIRTLSEHDRCKAIMACGTGKTLMSLRLTEKYLENLGAKESGLVLFCAPSIALVGQSMREWLAQSRLPLSALVVCSDAKASRREDSVPMSLADFEYPATTKPDRLCVGYRGKSKHSGITVIFSTYQSIDVIREAQKLGLPDFDLVICDEAHRTTGSALPGVSKQEASVFMKVHYDENVRAAKRLYMTATPRIYGEKAKRKGAEEDFTIASMDDEAIYGPLAYEIKFGEAVEQKLLTDYKVVVLTVEEDALNTQFDDRGIDGSELKSADVGKILGCWKGLAVHGENTGEDVGLGQTLIVDNLTITTNSNVVPLRRAVGFCQTISSSKTICEMFSGVVQKYVENSGVGLNLQCTLEHVDGQMNSVLRNQKLAWLGEDVPENECRILTNARCLAEGIDVPTLDAVIFFNAKNSTVDIVQAVGRVMRRAPGKDFGYIILPIVVPSGMTPEEALDKSDVFANVWRVLQALRSHDERIEAKINALALEQKAAERDLKADSSGSFASHEGWDASAVAAKRDAEQHSSSMIAQNVQQTLALTLEKWALKIGTTLVKKCGTRIYWDAWSDDVAQIAERQIIRIKDLLKTSPDVARAFEVFLTGLRESLNPGITVDDAVEMVAQHTITIPVFEALFGDFEFAKLNPVSVVIDQFLEQISSFRIDEAADNAVLGDVYASVRRRAASISTGAARQQLIRDLYEQFFAKAFTKTSDKMGVVYTPTEIIDYILRETNRVLQREFGKSLADKGVHILDPFAGTGSFLAHLIESDLIPDEQLEQKYQNELHSNEILLLAYYIMTINIEYAYHQRISGSYTPFGGGYSLILSK